VGIGVHVGRGVGVRGLAVVKHEVSLGVVGHGVTHDAEAGPQGGLYVTGSAEALVIVQPRDDGACLLVDVCLSEANIKRNILATSGHIDNLGRLV
jgi:hypothetical protein